MGLRSHLKSVAKAVTWRVFAAVDTLCLTYLVTGRWTAAFGVVGFEVFTKSFIYYAHERAWELPLIARAFAPAAVAA